MGRAPCCEKVGLKKGRWTREEDEILTKYIQTHGDGSWRSLPKNAGLLRCGKSCRLRWINYLRADLKRGNITPEEQQLIVQLHSTLGKRWSLIAGHLPGRTDNEIKNYWNSHLSRRIYSFNKTVATTGNNQPSPTAMNADTTVGGTSTTIAVVNAAIKKRKGRTSRSCMKKKTLMSLSPESSNKRAGSKKDVHDTNQDHLMTMALAPAPALAPAVGVPFIKEVFKGARMHGSYVDNTGWNTMGGGGETADTAMLSGLGPYEWLDSEIMRLDEFLMQGESMDLDMGLDVLEEMEREGDIQGLNQATATEKEMEKAAVVMVGYKESNGEWYNCSGNHNNSNNNNNNSSSSSVNDWFDWDWTSGVDCRNQGDEGEKMLAWLWGSNCSWTDEEASDNNSSLPKDTQEGIV